MPTSAATPPILADEPVSPMFSASLGPGEDDELDDEDDFDDDELDEDLDDDDDEFDEIENWDEDEEDGEENSEENG